MSNRKEDREQFIERYDKLIVTYKDPIEVMFDIMCDEDGIDPGVRRAAASDLLAYRFPKTKAIDLQLTTDGGQAGFFFSMVPFNATIQQPNAQNPILAKDEFTALEQVDGVHMPIIIEHSAVPSEIS